MGSAGEPGEAVEVAMRERPLERVGVPTEASIEAVIEAGTAAIAAGEPSTPTRT